MGVRFAHTADWQLGMKGGRFGEAAETITAERVRTLGRLLEAARSRGIATVLACGDLFEHSHVADEIVAGAASEIAAYPEIVVHCIPGNHDPSGPGSAWRRDAMTRLTNLRLHDVPYEGRGIEIEPGFFLHPFPVQSRYDNEEPLHALPDLHDVPGLHVGMAHGHVLSEGSFGGHEDDVNLPLDSRHVERSGLDYLALGHWHSRRHVSPHIAYSGTHEPTRFEETDPGQILIVEIPAKGAVPSIEAVPVAKLAWRRLEVALEHADDLTELSRRLEGDESDVLELRLSGRLEAALESRVRELVDNAGNGRVFVATRTDRLAFVDDESTDVGDPLLRAALDEIAGDEAGDDLKDEAAQWLKRWAREEAS